MATFNTGKPKPITATQLISAIRKQKRPMGDLTVKVARSKRKPKPSKPKTTAAPQSAEDQGLKEAYRAADADTNLKYDPLFRQVRVGQRVSDQQQKNITDWFDQYKGAVETARQQAQAGYAGAATATTSTAVQNRQGEDARLVGIQDASSRDLARRAADNRQGIANSFGAYLASLGANANAQYADKGRIASGAQLQARTNEQGNRRRIDEKLTDLLRERGEYRLSRRESRASDLRDALNEQLAIAAATQDKAEGNRIKVLLAKLAAETTRRGQDITADTAERGQDVGLEKAKLPAKTAPKGTKAPKPKKPTQQYYNALRSIDTLANKYRAGIKQGLSMAQIAAAARANGYNDDLILSAAADLVTKGRVTGPLAGRIVRERGFALPIGYRTSDPKRIAKKNTWDKF